MKKIIFSAILFFIFNNVCAAEWMQYQLIERPYHDERGNVISSIEGRHNRWGIDEIYGGGFIYPDLSGHKILKQYERQGTLLVELDIPESTAVELAGKNEPLKTIATHRVRKARKRQKTYPERFKIYNFKDFKARRITDAEAESILKNWGMWPETTSGVTYNAT